MLPLQQLYHRLIEMAREEERERILTQVRELPETYPEYESNEYDAGMKDMKIDVIRVIKTY